MIETVKHFPQDLFTVASLYEPESGELRIGLSLVCPGDTFSKKVGYRKALGRAMSRTPSILQQVPKNLTPPEITALTIQIAQGLDLNFFARVFGQDKIQKQKMMRRNKLEAILRRLQ